ncbi:hypothetical protein AJ87_05405 [Rhizobium yanglingense]|nr:hypothetical protein AJ87_05405 [Rhizobium yanglingense]
MQSAIEAYRKTLALDPEDIFGASLKLALLGDTETPDRPPSRYVERLFDDYAARFETSLVEKLDYTVPQKLAALVAATGRKYSLAVDLGCGTGLLGPKFAPVPGGLKATTSRRTCSPRPRRRQSTITWPRPTFLLRQKAQASLRMAQNIALI